MHTAGATHTEVFASVEREMLARDRALAVERAKTERAESRVVALSKDLEELRARRQQELEDWKLEREKWEQEREMWSKSHLREGSSASVESLSNSAGDHSGRGLRGPARASAQNDSSAGGES